MYALQAAQYGNEITLKYAHKEPTARDLRRMAELLRREAEACAGAAWTLEQAEAEKRRAEDEVLP